MESISLTNETIAGEFLVVEMSYDVQTCRFGLVVNMWTFRMINLRERNALKEITITTSDREQVKKLQKFYRNKQNFLIQ